MSPRKSEAESEFEDMDVPVVALRQEVRGICGRVLPFAARLTPAQRRNEWLREWRAELWCLQHGGRRVRWDHDVMSAASLAYGMMADAAWLGFDAALAKRRGTASACLWVLAAWCLVCAGLERMMMGSWTVFWSVLETHFLNGYIFIAAPAVFASAATNPVRPPRCEGTHRRGWLTTKARWNLFLWAKVALTLALGFFACMAATAPLRMEIGRWADWVEMPLFAVTVTAGLRWALLNQEQRCQTCLRMLKQPTRLGPPSYNFLEWSGMELACSDGHGQLHVPEMRGSWCWYDLWVERESGSETVERIA